ncbi:transposase [Candidatus Woesearchaeota archaeon]|nr:transposase [Candidatus Woesearchaeota archaeon]
MGRYVRHPAIANGRIMCCDKKRITFFYNDNCNRKILVKKSIGGFITSLIQHIPPPQFKMIRYYGAYSRKQKKRYSLFLKD